jgi:hypothetical protein
MSEKESRKVGWAWWVNERRVIRIETDLVGAMSVGEKGAEANGIDLNTGAAGSVSEPNYRRSGWLSLAALGALLALLVLWFVLLRVAGMPPSWVKLFDGGVTDRAGKGFSQAGGHPFEATTTFELNRTLDSGGNVVPDGGQVRNVLADPPGGVRWQPDRPASVRVASSSFTSEFAAIPFHNFERPPGVAVEGGYRHVQVRSGDTSQALAGLVLSVRLWGVPVDPADAFERGCQDGFSVSHDPPGFGFRSPPAPGEWAGTT